MKGYCNGPPYALWCSAVPCGAVQCSAVSFNALRCCPMLCGAVQSSAVLSMLCGTDYRAVVSGQIGGAMFCSTLPSLALSLLSLTPEGMRSMSSLQQECLIKRLLLLMRLLMLLRWTARGGQPQPQTELTESHSCDSYDLRVNSCDLRVR